MPRIVERLCRFYTFGVFTSDQGGGKVKASCKSAPCLTILFILASYLNSASAKYPIRKVSGKSKRAVVFIGKNLIKKNDLLKLFDDNLNQSCTVKVLKIKKRRALISTKKCNFNISTKNRVADLDIDSELLESEINEKRHPRRKRGIASLDLGSTFINPYLEGFVGLQKEETTLSDLEISNGGIFLGAILSSSRKRDFSIALYRSIGEGDISVDEDKLDFEYSHNDATIMAAPTYFSPLIRPIFIYSRKSTDIDFDESYSETTIKSSFYGLQYDLSRNRENDFIRGYFAKTKTKSSDSYENTKTLGVSFRKKLKKGWFQLIHTQGIDNESNAWSVSASIRQGRVFSNIGYNKLGFGNSSISLNISFYFDYILR